MNYEELLVLLVLIVILYALIKEWMRPGMLLFSAVIVFMALGIISAEEALAGFSNKGMITIAVLFLISEGIRQTGALNKVAQFILPKVRGTYPVMLMKILLPVSILSAFLNNTPVIIIFAPMVKKWAERLKMPYQKFLIPLSYATIFGGVCTLIGTSTNLVIHGLMLENGYEGISMFELGKVGIFIAFFGFIYLAIFGYRLLPGNRGDSIKEGAREYLYDLVVPAKSRYVGHELVNGILPGLRNFRIIRVVRNDKTFDTKNNRIALLENDVLVVMAQSESLEDFISNPDLKLKNYEQLDASVRNKKLMQVEVVIAPRFPGIGKIVGEFDFFNQFQAAIMAIHRNGERISTDINNVKLRDGDNLMLLTTEQFIKNWSESKIFYLTSYVREYGETSRHKRWIALAVVILMVVGATFGQTVPFLKRINADMFFFAAIATVILTMVNVIPHQKYTKFISWDIIITIACAFGISTALFNSGASGSIVQILRSFSKEMGPVGMLACVYLVTMVTTEVVTNNAAAAFVFPIALSAAQSLGVDPRPFFIAICIAASASFSTPIGYQTNLIVRGIGHYRFRNYLKIGLPLNAISFILSMILIPRFWDF